MDGAGVLGAVPASIGTATRDGQKRPGRIPECGQTVASTTPVGGTNGPPGPSSRKSARSSGPARGDARDVLHGPSVEVAHPDGHRYKGEKPAAQLSR